MYALGNRGHRIITNTNNIVNIADNFKTDLYSIRSSLNVKERGVISEQLDIRPVKKEEVQKALEAMQRGDRLLRIR